MTDKELRRFYSIMNILKKQNSDCSYFKKKIREENKRRDQEREEISWEFTADDSRYMAYKLPYLFTEEEKKEFIADNWWYVRNDGRDCTGFWFTTRIKLVDCGNETIVYHRQERDV